MLEQNIWIISAFLKVIGGFFAFSASLCTFFAVFQDGKHEQTKEWFRTKWVKIGQNRWLSMPEKTISAILKTKKNISEFSNKLFEVDIVGWVICLSPILLFNVGILVCFGLFVFWISLSLSIPCAVIIIDTFEFIDQNTRFTSWFSALLENLSKWFKIAIIIFPSFGAAFTWILIALNTKVLFSFLSMLIAMPCFFLIFLGPMMIGKHLSKGRYNLIRNETNIVIYGVSLGLSFSITFLSFLIGNMVSNDSHIPQTFQMLVSNVIFDGATVLLTFAVLGWSLKEKSWLRVPAAIIIDVAIAVVLAYASLYIGLFMSDNHLSLKQVTLVLVGISPSGKNIELGPYFWAMHTSFIPTCIYLTLILIGWFGKSILIPVEWFLGKGQSHKNPMALTAALFTLLATTFVLSGLAVDAFEKHFDKKESVKQEICST